MYTVTITCQGPIGYQESTVEFSEDAMLLTPLGEVKPIRRLREGDILVRFPDADYAYSTTRWTITKMVWHRKRKV